MIGILLLGAAVAATSDAQLTERYAVCLRRAAIEPGEPLTASEDAWRTGWIAALSRCSSVSASWREIYIEEALDREPTISEAEAARQADLRLSVGEVWQFVSWREAVTSSARNLLTPPPYDPMISPDETEQ